MGILLPYTNDSIVVIVVMDVEVVIENTIYTLPPAVP